MISILMAAYNDPSDNRGCQLPYFRGAVYTIKSAIESVQAQGCVDFGERIYMKLRLGVVI